MSFQPKSSRAIQMWIAVVLGVLVVLFFETQGSRRMNEYNFVINTNDDAIGAWVLVDNEKVGTITKSTPEGPGGGVYMGFLRRGKHVVELRKDKESAFRKEIEMERELYLGVDLQPLSH